MSQRPADDGELRRRAAWLLGMLVIVAVLIVVVMSALLHGGGSGTKTRPLGPDPITATAPQSAPKKMSHAGSSSATTSPASSTSSTPASSTSTLPTGTTSCPSAAPCALSGDVGNALPAINAYLTSHGKSAVPGSVSAAAQACALNRGDNCSGGWAETELSTPDGKLAVQKISQFAKFLDPGMKSIQIGWAYNPSTKTYYFSTIRQG